MVFECDECRSNLINAKFHHENPHEVIVTYCSFCSPSDPNIQSMANSPSRKENGSSTKTKSSLSTSTPHPLLNHNNVFLFIPNLIGYTRVFLAAYSLYFMRWHPKACTWLYIVSCLLDAFDGMAARRFNQCTFPILSPTSTITMEANFVATKFGAVLDMVTDRCTTACLLCYLCSAYPAYTVYFQAIISVDLASHYMHMYRYPPDHCIPGLIVVL
jgi:CDP-diacylglycerol--inositol 3-phosphatidyltransferase